MSVISIGRTETYKFTDTDGDAGEWDFTPRQTENDREASSNRVATVHYKFGAAGIDGGDVQDKERQAKALCVVRTVSWRGKAFMFPKGKDEETVEYQASDGVTYKSGDLMPYQDIGVRAEMIGMFPFGLLSDAEAFLNGLEKPRSKEETKSVRKGTRNASTPEVNDDDKAGSTGTA